MSIFNVLVRENGTNNWKSQGNFLYKGCMNSIKKLSIMILIQAWKHHIDPGIPLF